jgi:hypothetical protein
MFLWNILNGYFQAVAPRWQDATASYPTVHTKSIGSTKIKTGDEQEGKTLTKVVLIHDGGLHLRGN